MLQGERERLSAGQKLRREQEKRLGIKNKWVEAIKNNRDKRCIQMSEIFLAYTDLSTRELSSELFKAGFTNKKGKPLHSMQVARYRKRINELIKEGLIKQPEP